MPRNGTGTYTLVNNTWYPPVNGVLAQSSDWQTFIDDVAAALTQSVSKDGQTPMTGNLPMGNNKITGLANGSAATDAVAFGQVNLNAGQCRLTKSGANLLLSPFSGNRLTINGVVCTIPPAGITLAPTALAINTTFYIYATASGTAVNALEASTTVYTVDATTGMPIKTADPTRTLVGMARTIAGPAWQDATNQRFVLSWFNPMPIDCSAALPVAQGNSGAAYSEIISTLRCEFLHWANSAASFSFSGTFANNVTAGPNQAFTTYALDGVVVDGYTGSIVSTANVQLPVACSYVLPKGTAEGYHYVTLFAQQTAVSTSTYAGGGTPGLRCVNSGIIQG